MIRKIMRDKAAYFGLIAIAFLVGLALFAPMAANHNPIEVDANAVLSPPSLSHFFGTDMLGRDVFSRIVYGSRISLSIGIISVFVSVLIGTFIGAIAGYYGDKIDYIIMRFVDIMLSFPVFFLILAVVSMLEPSIFNIMIIIGATGWMAVARLVRAEVLTLKERDFVLSAKVMGGSDTWIITRHLIPNAIGPVCVAATLGVGGAILTESALSFLGLGVQPPTPSWGNMLMDGKSALGYAWWIILFPGVFITITVLSFNMLGEGLRKYFKD